MANKTTTQPGSIPWSMLDIVNDPIANKLFIEACRESYQEQAGNRGACTCERPGYQRRNPKICRNCNKPHRGR